MLSAERSDTGHCSLAPRGESDQSRALIAAPVSPPLRVDGTGLGAELMVIYSILKRHFDDDRPSRHTKIVEFGVLANKWQPPDGGFCLPSAGVDRQRAETFFASLYTED